MIPDRNDAVLKQQAWLVAAVAVGCLVLVPLTVGFGHRYAPLVGALPFGVLLLFFWRRQARNNSRGGRP